MLKKKDSMWYIFFIVVAVLFFSALCWMGTVRNFDSYTDGYYASIKHDITSQIKDVWSSSIVKEYELSRIDSVLTYIITGQIASNQVIQGKNRWLFLKSDLDGSNPIADYEGTNTFSIDDKNEILESVLTVQKRVENSGTKFAVIIPPNKESVYYEYMPDTYYHAPYSRTDDLVGYLRNNGVNIVSPKDELICGIGKNQLYYSSDTHWNYLGAYIGLKEVLHEFDIDIPTLLSYEIHKTERDGGDLAQLAGLGNLFNDTEYVIEGYDMPCCKKEQLADKVFYYSNGSAKISGVMLLIGDSFRDSMTPLMVNLFTEVYVVHRDCYTLGMFEEINPDYVIMEYAERYSDKLAQMSTLVNGY